MKKKKKSQSSKYKTTLQNHRAEMIRNAQLAPCRPRLGHCAAPPWDGDPAPQRAPSPTAGGDRLWSKELLAGKRRRRGDGKAGPCPLHTHSRQDSPSHSYVPMCEGVPRLCPRGDSVGSPGGNPLHLKTSSPPGKSSREGERQGGYKEGPECPRCHRCFQPRALPRGVARPAGPRVQPPRRRDQCCCRGLHVLSSRCRRAQGAQGKHTWVMGRGRGKRGRNGRQGGEVQA